MKIVNLKSMSWIMALAMIVIASFTACSDDEDNKNQVPVFPEIKNIACNAGETKDFTFEANMDWILISTNITWCKFQQNGEDKESISGSAGTNTVTIKVTDDGQTAEKASTAKLELSMGGQKATIAEVTRSALGYELKIYDLDGNEIQALELGYQKFAQFKVVGNYRYALSGCPEWIELEAPVIGTPGQEVTGGLQIVEDGNREKYPIEISENDEIIFSDEAGKAVKSFPISFKGMGAKDIEITTPTTDIFNWNVSLDGTQFIQTSGVGGESTIIKDAMEFTIKTLNDEYQIVFMEKYSDDKIHLMNSSKKWMSCENNGKGSIKLKITELVPTESIKKREGYVFAFPQAKYDEIADKLEETILTEDHTDIKSEYQQSSSLMILFEQKDIETENTGFEVLNSLTSAPIEVEKVTDQDIINKFDGCTEVYSMQGHSKDNYIIVPLLVDDLMETFSQIQITDMEKNPVQIKLEPTMQGEKAAIMLYYQYANITKDIAITFVDKNNNPKQILIIKAGENTEENIFSATFGENGTIPIIPYDGDDTGYLTGKTDVAASNMFKLSMEKEITSMIFVKSQKTIKEIKSYDHTSDFDTQLTDKDLTGSTENLDLELIDTETIAVYTGSDSVIPEKTSIVITCEDGTKYLLYINRRTSK